jgi:nitrogen PTS system EIIA component
MKLATLLDEGAILLDGDIDDKEALFRVIGETLSRRSIAMSAETVIAKLNERERKGTTFLGRGVAVPHALVSACTEIRLVLVRPSCPVPYDDHGHQARLIFALLAPSGDRDRYVRVLARIARLCLSEDFVTHLTLAHDVAELRALLRQSDEAQAVSGPGGAA